jgi:hypothetical protein
MQTADNSRKSGEGTNMRCMRCVGTIAGIWVALVAVFLFSGLSSAADNPEGYLLENEHYFAQDVEGDGFVMAYQKVNTKTLQLQNYMHGSGTMDAATIINSSQEKHSGWNYKSSTNSWEKKCVEWGEIHFVEQNEMTYSPRAFAYGTGYYAEHPVVFNSKLKEKTQGKNYQDEVGTSMHHQIEYASAFQKDIGVNLECKDGYTTKEKGYGLAEMNIEETVTEGTVHVGELMTDPDQGWKSPLIEIDENYVGSFAIQKNMKVCGEKGKISAPTDWLSCCFGGYDGMDDEDKLWGEEEIFDCTCRDVAWGESWNDTSKAQYCKEC